MNDQPSRGTVGVLGAGVMGETLLAGLLRAGYPPSDIVITEKRAERGAELAERYGVEVLDNVEAAKTRDTLVLVLKPQDIRGLLDEIAEHVDASTLVISIAAGIPSSYIESRLPEGTPVIRVMPNTPALVGQGMSAISPGSAAGPQHVQTARDILRATGRVVEVAEYQQDAVTALSGSGPAYIFLVAEAMIDAGVLMGLPRDIATQLATQTIYGAATMISESGTHPTLLREQVSSPGGTTVAGLRALEQHGLRSAFMAAVEAAHDRSKELSDPS